MKPTLEQWRRIAEAVHSRYGDEESGLLFGDITALESFIVELEADALRHYATGAEIRDFFENGWDETYYHDDSEIPLMNDAGNWILEDDKLYDLSKLGMMVPITFQPLSKYKSFEVGFMAWKAKKATP